MRNIGNMFLGIIVLIIFLILIAPYAHGANLTVTGLADENGEFTGEKIIPISDSGSKTLYGVDNLVGAKNKIIDYPNKDKYIIDSYISEDNTSYKLIYPNGEQNNADKKSCYINGSLEKMVRFSGRDSPILKINYTMYIHDEILLVFNNPIGERYNNITNTLGLGGTWSNNGKIFTNQISGLEFINTTEGNYTFSHWIDETGKTVTDYFFQWTGNLTATHIYTAIYDFVANPVPEPIENETDTNITNETDVDPTPAPENNTDTNHTDNETDNNNTSEETNDTDDTIDYILIKNNTITIADFEEINNTTTNTTSLANEQEQTILNQHTTGIDISNLLAILLILIVLCFLIGTTRRR